MLYNYKSIKESFDFNEVLNNDDENNNLIGNQIYFKNVVDNIKTILNQNQLITYILTYSLEKQSILIQYKNKNSSNVLSLSATKITIINNQNIILDVYNCANNIFNLGIEEDINYQDIINNNNIQILKKITQLYGIQMQNIEIGIVLTYDNNNNYNYGKIYNSDLNNLPIVDINDYVIKNVIMPFINIGYNIIIKYIHTNKTSDYEIHNNLNYNTIFYPFKNYNIFINNIDLEYNLNKDIKKFIKYAKKYLIPSNGHILSGMNGRITNYETYWKNLSLCKFTDKDTKMKIKNTSFKITNKDIEIVYNKIKNAKNYTTDIYYDIYFDILKNLKENKASHFYARIVIASILGMSIETLSLFKIKLSWINKNISSLDSILLKAYFNYIIDNINNKGDIYYQIKNIIN